MLFYTPFDNKTTKDSIIKIDEENSAHFFSMRVKEEDILKISNLNGILAKAEVIFCDKKSKELSLKILEIKTVEKPEEKVLIQAQIDKNYMEKLIEILPLAKITKVVFFEGERSLKYKINFDRLNKILIRSHEQSENPNLVKIEILEKKNFEKYLEKNKPKVLHCEEKTTSSNGEVNSPLQKGNCNSILVGAEGGWSENEIKVFKKLNLEFINLGKIVYPAWIAGYSYFLKLSR